MRGHNKKTIHSPEYAVMLRLLRTARNEAGMTLEQVAARLGYQASAISKMERGELRLDYVQLRDYCRAVGVPLIEFVQRVEDTLERDNG